MPIALNFRRAAPVCVALLCVSACLWHGAATAQGAQDALTVELDADSTRVDGPNGVMEFTGVTITQGDLRVRADSARASGLDFQDSAWTFSGNVRFSDTGTDLTAQTAVLRFASQRLRDATLSGSPLRFKRTGEEDTRLTAGDGRLEFANGKLAKAYFNGTPVTFAQGDGGERSVESTAASLTYDALAGTITLLDGARIVQGGKEISGNSIVYNFVERSFVAASDNTGQQRVRINITAPNTSGADAPPPDGDRPDP